MSETLIPVEGLGETNSIQPFALQFLEAIPQADLEEVSGRYNDKLQVWEYGDEELSEAFPVASKIGAERPPTVSTVPTPISVNITRMDTYVDD